MENNQSNKIDELENRLKTIEQDVIISKDSNKDFFDLNSIENRLLILESKQSEKKSFIKKHLSFSNIFAFLAIVFSVFQYYNTEKKSNNEDFESYFAELANINNTYKNQGNKNDISLLSRMIDKVNLIEKTAINEKRTLTPQQKISIAQISFYDRDFNKAYNLMDEALNYYLENNIKSRFIPTVIYAHYSCSKYLGKNEDSFDRYSEYSNTIEGDNNKKLFWTQVYFQKIELEVELEQFEKIIPTLESFYENICPTCENLYQGYFERIQFIEYGIPDRMKKSDSYQEIMKKIHNRLKK